MIGQFNITAEFISIIIAFLTLYLMCTTSPRKTTIYFVDFFGVLLSLVAILLNGAILMATTIPTEELDSNIIRTLIIAFYITYIAILELIFGYIDQLSYKERMHKNIMVTISIAFFAVTFGISMFLLLSGRMYQITSNGLTLLGWFHVYLFFGMIEAFLCFITMLVNRRSIPHKLHWFIGVFCIFDLLLLIAQYFMPHIIFSSITYVVPFWLFYLFFHSNPYDEVNGCQNYYAYMNRFEENRNRNRSFLVLSVEFPRYKHTQEFYSEEMIEYASAYMCRRVESIVPNVRIYSVHDYRYNLLIDIDNQEREDAIVADVERILSTPIAQNGDTFSPVYRLIAFRGSPIIDTDAKLGSFQKYLYGKMMTSSTSASYTATAADYTDFIEQYEIMQALRRIKREGNLDDEHVLCFAQPIFNVEHGSFRTAEALMRLQLDGKMIFPDKFIPAAEQTNCIHALTRIILNKVCKKVAELSASYDFDAITVNCSTLELSDPDLPEDLLGIIRSNGIDCSKICLELTESAMFEDYTIFMNNITKLRAAGVQFYLDDFGTGYSNLERVLTCPFKTIKFDKSLLYKSMNDTVVRDLMVSMVEIFKKQGFQLLIEGVEDDTQSAYSIEKGFQYIQGYRYSKPLPIDKLTEFFTKKG